MCGHHDHSTHAFENTTVLNEDPRLIAANVALSAEKDPVPGIMGLNHEWKDTEWWQHGYRRAFTDGGADNPELPHIRRAGYGVYVGKDHPCNVAKPLTGRGQTVYEAELRAVLEATSMTDVPTWITSDNEAVVNTADQVFRGNFDIITMDIRCRTLWLMLVKLVKERPYGFFMITWIRSHLNADEAISDDMVHFSKQEIQWNNHADRLATDGKNANALDYHIRDAALMRMRLCMIAQSMCVEIWIRKILDLAQEEMENLGEEEDPWGNGPIGFDDESGDPPAPEQQPGEEEVEEEVNPMSRINERLSVYMSKYPMYAWRIPTPAQSCGGWKNGRSDTCTDMVKGRLSKKVFPHYLWPPFVTYMKNVLWYNDDVDSVEHRGCTYAELAIDYEIATGMNICKHACDASTTWTAKASLFACMLKEFLRHNTHYRNIVTDRRCNSMNMFGFERGLAGIRCRPRFLGGISTLVAIAHNAIRNCHRPQDSSTELTRPGHLREAVVYWGINRKPAVIDPVARDIFMDISDERVKQRDAAVQANRDAIIAAQERHGIVDFPDVCRRRIRGKRNIEVRACVIASSSSPSTI